MIQILILLIVIGLIFYFFNTKFGERIKLRVSGTTDEIITKDASTPEGAKAYYNVAIAKKEDDYQKMYSFYTQMLGKIKTYEEQLRSFQKESMQLNIKINNCIEEGNDDGAKLFLKRQQEISERVDIVKNALEELRENAKLQKENVDNALVELKDLKAEKDNAILTLETAQVTKALKATAFPVNKEEEKMLEKVRDGVSKTKEEANGSKIAYENSSAVLQHRLDKDMKDKEISDKLEALKKAKNKKI